jgi:hypothetical protein
MRVVPLASHPHNLDPVARLIAFGDNHPIPFGVLIMTLNELVRNIIVRMAEIDSDITTDGYDTPKKNREPRPPEGDDYNTLWDALIDEIRAACPDLDVSQALQDAAKGGD